ncbi:aspartate/methionine/tyrosine aminotransferase [Azospirillum brasilense]|uniref:Aspartate/methionine/tyrosine aminotransferase n=1 Tax=Azospirillum brasilense TaxID=192 RepID=A0A560CS61_AZOBR|nr:aminotransferase [Azospirillum brasilense]TWA87696.1 aspartate/methionine/tyrosine aminotransferase [Azospirillum brasilense]
MKSGNAILSSYGTTIFEVMSRLSDEHKAINLGQGFPDERGPADVLDVAAKAILEGWNQYPPMMGTPELRQAVAAHGKRFYGLDIDWKTEVMVTSGATEALTASLLGLINPGDEVVLFQPMYDSYLPIVRLAGGVPRFVSLKAPDWSFTRADLEAVFSPKTKLVLINDPLNPAAKVFTRAELELLAEFVQRFDAFAVCDEVYEHIIFDGLAHIPLMTLPGMRDRCLKIGSAGKTFSLTGWKVGYVTGAPHLLQPVVKAHQYITFTTPPNLQAAVAYGLGKDEAYFTALAGGLQAKRDRLADGLRSVGFEVLPSAGTYFVVADVSPFGFDGNDEDFCRRLTAEAGVTAIPVGAFFVEDAPRSFIRFCFSKRDEILDGAVERLSAYFARR